jgi:hypothetical protein
MFRRSVWRALPVILLLTAGASAHAAAPRVLVTISKETTYITEPLRADGYPDYLGDLNQRCSHGVTPENNAAVLLWRAVGPEGIREQDRKDYFRMLGMPLLPEKGDYLVTSRSHIILNEDTEAAPARKDQSTALAEQLEAALKRPWRKQEFPVWAAWVETNEKPLALIVEASKRPRRYDPLVGGQKRPLIYVLMPDALAYRDAADALVARAMLQLGEGKIDEAWEDLLACQRLVRLMAQGPHVVQFIAAASISERASRGVCALLQHPGLTAAKIAKMREDFDSLPAMPKLVEKIDLAERLVFLDYVLTTARSAPASPATVAKSLEQVRNAGVDARELASMASILESSGDATVDWDIILRMGNARYDQYVAALRMPAGVKRTEAATRIDESKAAMPKAANNDEASEQSPPSDTPQVRSRRIGEAFLAVFSNGLATPLCLEDRMTMRFELTGLAFALAAYRADHGSYPAKLADLTPKYVSAVAKDIFNDGELHYRPEKDGYLLYSVGDNVKDDGGKSYEDREKGMTWEEASKHGKAYDDLTVRMSAPSH